MIAKNLAFLLLIFSPFILLSGCESNSGKQIVFDSEKALHNAEKLYATASIKPDLADLKTWGKIKDAYLAAIAFCWTNLDSVPASRYPEERKDLESVAFIATSRLASIYFAEAKFDSSIIVLRGLLSLTKLTDRPLLSSQSNLARAYHAKGDWTSGMEIYKSIINTFYPPVDNENEIIFEVLNLPMELFNIGVKIQDIPNTYEGSLETREYYIKIINEWPDTELARASRQILARLMASFGKWDEAVVTLGQIVDSTGQIDIMESIKIGEIYNQGKKDHNTAISIYRALLDRVDDTTTLAAIYTKIGIAQFDNKSYLECRETLEGIKDKYRAVFMSDPTPQKYIALSYEKQGNWERAENEYQWLITNFANTEDAFEAYLTIAEHYAGANNKRLSDTWYQKADEFYLEKQSEFTGSALEASAISYRAEVARRQGNWPEAAKRLEELYFRFPDKDAGVRGLRNAIEIYRAKLNNQARADSLQALIRLGT